MLNILYANPYSLFDYTSGSSNSIRLILKNFTHLNCNVNAIFSSVSCSKAGYSRTKEIINQSNKNLIVNNFKFDNIQCTALNTRHWDRRELTFDEEKIFYEETISLISKNKINLLISWGNLKLEESLFKEAKRLGIKLCFYLVNPNYLGEQFYLKDNADYIITDSYSTKKIYQNFIKNKIIVLPKCLEENSSQTFTKKKSKSCLIVNPSINKGLEPLLSLAERIQQSIPEIKIWCIDGREQIYNDLQYLGYGKSDIPQNINIFPACNDLNSIYKHVKIVFLLSIWHESGSRVIQESYSNGIPVICFNTGGNKEFIGENINDIFKLPNLYKDKNNRLRMKKWDNQKMFERISFFFKNEKFYDEYSQRIFKKYDINKRNQDFREALQELIFTIRKT